MPDGVTITTLSCRNGTGAQSSNVNARHLPGSLGALVALNVGIRWHSANRLRTGAASTRVRALTGLPPPADPRAPGMSGRRDQPPTSLVAGLGAVGMGADSREPPEALRTASRGLSDEIGESGDGLGQAG